VHVIVGNSSSKEPQELESLVERLRNAGISALIDERRDVRLGEKFMDADLIGVPVQVVVGGKKQNASEAEVKRRRDIGPAAMVRRESVVDYIRSLSDRCLE
jgi:prolyl-tRNA synthetase